jgi:Ser/Thr protein kinase RdoA (MazF antagonist)
VDAAAGPRPLPVTLSVLAAPALGAEVAARYDLAGTVGCVLLARSLNDSYLVESAAGRHVLRVYRAGWRTDAAVAYEVDLLRHLDRAGAAVAAPVPTRGGGFLWHACAPEGTRQAVLFRYAEGGRPTDPYPADAHGRALAEMHTALDGFASPHARTPLDRAFLIDEPVAALRAFPGLGDDAVRYVERVAAAVGEELRHLERAGLDAGPCHGDPHGFNLHVAPDGRVVPFDFDFCGPGWRAHDLAVFRWWQRTQRQPEGVWESFLRGYAGRRPLGDADLAAVPPLVAARHLWLLGLAVRETEHSGQRWWLDAAFFDGRLRALADWLAEHPCRTAAPWACALPPGSGDRR